MKAVAAAAAHFPLDGPIREIKAFGTGHIHDTYKLTTASSAYLIQRLNTTIFTATDKIFSNQAMLTPLVRQGLIVETLPTKEGAPGLILPDAVWRVQKFIEGVYGPIKAESAKVVEQVAYGFAQFDKACLSLNPQHFQEVIPRFHSLTWRIKQFEEALEGASADRLNESTSLIEEARNFLFINDEMDELWQKGMPQRVCHNDTKADNVLLSLNDHSYQYVIDLDTVGPGTILYDFGDLMRTILSPTGESEPDSSKIQLNIDYFRTLACTYKNVLWESISGIEQSSLVFGGMYMTFIMALRFLTDYLNEDVYYKISFDNENWVRARNQLVLLKEMHRQREFLEDIINDL